MKMKKEEFEVGLYRHYKGGRYLVIAVAQTHEHNGDVDVMYVSLTHGTYTTRPLQQDSRKQDSWLDLVEWPDHKIRPRFIREAVALEDSRLLSLFGEKTP